MPPTEFQPTERDQTGLRQLLFYSDLAGGCPVHVSCFSEDEAIWIRTQLERLRPGLDVTVSWLEFHATT